MQMDFGHATLEQLKAVTLNESDWHGNENFAGGRGPLLARHSSKPEDLFRAVKIGNVRSTAFLDNASSLEKLKLGRFFWGDPERDIQQLISALQRNGNSLCLIIEFQREERQVIQNPDNGRPGFQPPPSP